MSNEIRVSVFLALSLDGFIARSDGRLDWLDTANERVPTGEDCGFADFFASVDVLVMGKQSFAQVLKFPNWPYASKPVVVLSRQPIEVPAALKNNVQVSAAAPAALVTQLAQAGYRHVYLDGGLVIHSFLHAGLVDELILTQIPVLLGSGKSLYGELPQDIWLELVRSSAYPFGYVQSHYRVKR